MRSSIFGTFTKHLLPISLGKIPATRSYGSLLLTKSRNFQKSRFQFQKTERLKMASNIEQEIDVKSFSDKADKAVFFMLFSLMYRRSEIVYLCTVIALLLFSLKP